MPMADLTHRRKTIFRFMSFSIEHGMVFLIRSESGMSVNGFASFLDCLARGIEEIEEIVFLDCLARGIEVLPRGIEGDCSHCGIIRGETTIVRDHGFVIG